MTGPILKDFERRDMPKVSYTVIWNQIIFINIDDLWINIKITFEK